MTTKSWAGFQKHPNTIYSFNTNLYDPFQLLTSNYINGGQGRVQSDRLIRTQYLICYQNQILRLFL